MTTTTSKTEEYAPSISRKLFWVCLCIFLFALGVRFLVWQNNKADIENLMSGVTQAYQSDAKTLLSGDVKKFVAGANPPVDASVLAHPPGYPIFVAKVNALFGENDTTFRVVQIIVNSLAPVLIFFIALRLFDFRVAVIAGILTAVSPQFSYYSSVILPDELSVLPILFAIYFLTKTVHDKKMSSAILCGVSIGLSCWLRSNTLLLPFIFAATLFVFLAKDLRLKLSLALLVSFVLTISPITIRNYLVFHSFVPLSLGMGTTLIEGLGDMDGRFGLPSTDEGVMEMDVRIANRPDYYGSLYDPDGVQRERERLKIGLAAIRENPDLFFASVVKRGTMVFRMERVPVIAPNKDEKATAEPTLYFLNLPLYIFQRLFITAVFLPLILVGVILLLRKKEHRTKLIILMCVPVYFMCVQSLLHTEYRYLLPASHCLLIISSVSIGFFIERISNLKFKISNI